MIRIIKLETKYWRSCYAKVMLGIYGYDAYIALKYMDDVLSSTGYDKCCFWQRSDFNILDRPARIDEDSSELGLMIDWYPGHSSDDLIAEKMKRALSMALYASRLHYIGWVHDTLKKLEEAVINGGTDWNVPPNPLKQSAIKTLINEYGDCFAADVSREERISMINRCCKIKDELFKMMGKKDAV